MEAFFLLCFHSLLVFVLGLFICTCMPSTHHPSFRTVSSSIHSCFIHNGHTKRFSRLFLSCFGAIYKSLSPKKDTILSNVCVPVHILVVLSIKRRGEGEREIVSASINTIRNLWNGIFMWLADTHTFEQIIDSIDSKWIHTEIYCAAFTVLYWSVLSILGLT